jgi:phosphoribosylformylglycinamidine synthase
VADVPANDLVLGGGAPVYHREYKEPAYYAEAKKFDINTVAEPKNYAEVMKHLAKHPNIASKKWVYEQYDSMVGTINMSTNKASSAAIVNLKDSDRALALSVDCNSRYVNADPEIGCAIAVAEASRNIVCSGGIGLAITNCLNFGNPYNPEVYWQFVGAIKGMGMACKKFETPVTGGNVSFYNQSSYGDKTEPVFPTPTIGMLGILDSKATFTGIGFNKPGDLIYLIGESANDINSSEYLYSFIGIKNSPAPHFNLDSEYQVQQAVAACIKLGVVASANDCADGGLFITLLESAMSNNLGFSIKSDSKVRKDAFLFGEAQSRVVISFDPANKEAVEQCLHIMNVPFNELGQVVSNDILIDHESFGKTIDFKQLYDHSIAEIMSEN